MVKVDVGLMGSGERLGWLVGAWKEKIGKSGTERSGVRACGWTMRVDTKCEVHCIPG